MFLKEMRSLQREEARLKSAAADLTAVVEKMDALKVLYQTQKIEASGAEDAVLAVELFQTGKTEFEYMLGEAATGVRHEAY